MPATLSLPLSAHELQEAMRNARPIDAARLDRVLRLEPGRGVVEVQANTTWRSLAARLRPGNAQAAALRTTMPTVAGRSEEHTSELQSRLHLVCRLLLEKKKKR